MNLNLLLSLILHLSRAVLLSSPFLGCSPIRNLECV